MFSIYLVTRTFNSSIFLRNFNKHLSQEGEGINHAIIASYVMTSVHLSSEFTRPCFIVNTYENVNIALEHRLLKLSKILTIL